MNFEHCFALHHLLLLDQLMSKVTQIYEKYSIFNGRRSAEPRFHSGPGVLTSTLWAYATIFKSTLTLG